MVKLFRQMWNDDAGYIISTEMLLIFVILVLGLVAGMGNIRTAIVNEMTETGNAILALSQAYSIASYTGCSSTSGATVVTDVAATVGLSINYTTTTTSLDGFVGLCP